ncbi:MAG: hypothetical protein ACR2G2_19390 [Pseudonocardia sp.]
MADTPWAEQIGLPAGVRNAVTARRLRSGTVGHSAFWTDFGMAFGGFKQSDIGREGGTEGLMGGIADSCNTCWRAATEFRGTLQALATG